MDGGKFVCSSRIEVRRNIPYEVGASFVNVRFILNPEKNILFKLENTSGPSTRAMSREDSQHPWGSWEIEDGRKGRLVVINKMESTDSLQNRAMSRSDFIETYDIEREFTENAQKEILREIDARKAAPELPFIPVIQKWYPGLSTSALAPLMGEEPHVWVEQMTRMKWPRFLIERAARSKTTEPVWVARKSSRVAPTEDTTPVERLPKPMLVRQEARAPRSVTPRAYAVDLLSSGTGPGRFGTNDWVVRGVSPMEPIPRPTTPTVASARRWVSGELGRLSKGLKKNQKVCGNEAVKALLQNPVDVAGLLREAKLYVQTFNREPVVVRERVSRATDHRLVVQRSIEAQVRSLFGNGRFLHVGLNMITTTGDFAKFAPWFRRDQPIFRKAMEFLAGASGIRARELQVAIDRIVPRLNVPDARVQVKAVGEEIGSAKIFPVPGGNWRRPQLEVARHAPKYRYGWGIDPDYEHDGELSLEETLAYLRDEQAGLHGRLESEEIQEEVELDRELMRAAISCMAPQNPQDEARVDADSGETCVAHLQGGTMSAPVTIEHRHVVQMNTPQQGNAAVESVVDNLPEAVAAVLDAGIYQFGERKARVAAQIASFLVAVYHSQSYTSTIAAFAQFVSGFDGAWDWLRRLVRTLAIRPQGAEEEPSFTWRFWEATFGCVYAVVVEEFFVPLRAILTEFAQTTVGMFSREFLREGCKRTASSVMDAIVELLRRLKRCVEECSFTPLWGAGWDTDAWLSRTEVLENDSATLTMDTTVASLRRRNYVMDKKIPPEWAIGLSIPQLMEELERDIVAGDRMAKHYERVWYTGSLVKARVEALRKVLNEFRSRERGSVRRCTPYFIVFTGNPCAGKTIMAGIVRDVLAHKFGLPTSPGSTYCWQLNANFQTGLDHRTTFVSMDDIDQSVAPDTAGIPNHAEVIIKLINNEPFPVEEADLALKGKTFAYPKVVTYTSNYENMHIRRKVWDESAVWRRVAAYVTVTGKDEFSTAHGMLDKLKAADAKTWEIYDIDVRFFDPTRWNPNNPDSLPLTDPRRISLSDLLVLIADDYAAHMRRQNQVLELIFSDAQLRCARCGLDVSVRKCGCPEQSLVVRPDGPQIVEKKLQGADPLSVSGVGHLLFEVWFTLWNFTVAYFTFRGFSDWVQKTVDFVARRKAARFDKGLIAAVSVGSVAGLIGLAIALRGGFSRYEQQGRENNATGALDASWKRAGEFAAPAAPPTKGATWTREELLEAVAECTGLVTAPNPMFFLVIAQNTILVPTHALSGDRLSLRYLGRDYTVLINSLTAAKCSTHSEVSIVHVPNFLTRRTLLAYIPEVIDQSVHQFDEVLVVVAGEPRPTQSNQVKHYGKNTSLTVDALFMDGDCGSAYIARHGKSWRLVAFHEARLTTLVGQVSSGAMFDLRSLRTVALGVGVRLQGVRAVSRSFPLPESVQVCRMPDKSEYHTAYSQRGPVGIPFGTLVPRVAGRTLKTRVKRSILSGKAAHLEERWCGEAGYWRLPHFGGFMREGLWISPYTEALAYKNEVEVDKYILGIALMDYLDGMDRLDTEGYQTLSEAACVRGIPGSYIRPMNLASSIGPPHSGPKHNFVVKIEDGVFAKEELWGVFDEVEEIVAQGEAPAPFVVWTLKDEALKPGKMPRTFNVFSAGHNMAFAKHYAPIHAFVRANMTFFECFVGINMTSAECMILVQHLAKVDPDLRKVLEGDGRKMDLHINGWLWEVTAMIMYAIAFELGLDAVATHSLVTGDKNAVHMIKGDIFRLLRNSSGGRNTIHLNSFSLSVGERLVWYSQRFATEPDFEMKFPRRLVGDWYANFYKFPRAPPTFSRLFDYRDHNALATFGDDMLCAKRELSGNYAEMWRSKVGLEMTGTGKGEHMRLAPIEEVTFLKRGFVWSPAAARYLTPLSKASLARCLVIKKDTTLSDLDAAAVSCTEVMRELVYWGEEEYEEFRRDADRWAVELGFVDNPYYNSKPFGFWWAKVVEGAFAAWEPPGAPDFVELPGPGAESPGVSENE
jgi:hypothetical protein